MATIKAIKTGDWSDTTTWDSGVIPTGADDVDSNLNKVVIDTDIDAESIYGDGTFVIEEGDKEYLLNSNIIGRLLIDIDTPNGDTSIVINGDVGGHPLGGIIDGSNLDIQSYKLNITVNGNVLGPSTPGLYFGIDVSRNGALNNYMIINGDVIGTYFQALRFDGQELIINGDIRTDEPLDVSYTYGAVSIAHGVAIVNGDIYASDGSPAIGAMHEGRAILKSGITCYTSPNGSLPISGNIFIEDGAIIELQMNTVEINTSTPTNNPPEILTNSPGGDCPEPQDVRKGVVYGDKTGLLAVPQPQQVAFGIPVDQSIGQAAISLPQLSTITGDQIEAAFEK